MKNHAFSRFKAVISKISMVSVLCSALPVAAAGVSTQSAAASNGPSGLPLPRFVSLKAKRVNMRVGPGREYKVEWMFTRPGLPLEITQEYGNWRKVRDAEGAEGWILQSLLSGKRTAVVSPWEEKTKTNRVPLKTAPDESAPVLAEMEPGVVTRVDECEDGWCRLSVSDYKGYAQQSALWGVYPDEQVE